MCTYRLLPHGSTPGTFPGNPLEGRGNGTVLVFLFCLLTLLDHWDPRDLLDGGSATGKVENALPGTMIDARQ